VHEEWLKKHDALPTSKAEKEEYRALVRKEVSKRTDTGFLRVSEYERFLALQSCRVHAHICSFVRKDKCIYPWRLPSLMFLRRACPQ
jgi:hypothetical protein